MLDLASIPSDDGRSWRVVSFRAQPLQRHLVERGGDMRPSESLQRWFESSLRPKLKRMAAKRRPDLPAPQVLIIAPGVRLSFGEVDRPFHTASAGKPSAAAAAGGCATG